MFQDTAGTTPVTTPGQTVALLLDKSKGLTLGTELLTNGDFSNGTTGWTIAATGTATVTSGIIRITSVSGRGTASQALSTIVGQQYRIDLGLISNGNAGFNAAIVRITSTNSYGGTLLTSASSAFSNGLLFFTATTTTTYIWLAENTATTSNFVEFGGLSVKSDSGNHATQATTASRPTYGIVPLGGRRNLLLATDTMATQSLTVAAVAHTLAFTGTGTVTLTGASIAGPLIGTGASNRVSLTFTPTAASLTLTVVGSVTLAQLELGSTATAYQRVTTQYDVTEAGVQSLSYLSFDGVDDSLVTPTITPGVDKAQVFVGVRKLTDTGFGAIVELSAEVAANNGSFLIRGPESGANYFVGSKGTATVLRTLTTYTAPITNSIAMVSDISGPLLQTRINGSTVDTSTAAQGTGNYLAYPLYIGRRGGTTLPFNGQIYNLIVRFGANLDAGTITSTETFVNQKTGAF
jgi:hypothetical protein